MAQSNTRLSPRQKMINLMYIVLTAMLALNVSSDVLDGFTQVQDGLSRSNANVLSRNDGVYSQISALAMQNPEKGNAWLEKATSLRSETQRLYATMDSLKLMIVRKADGADGDPAAIRHLDDLESASVVMLNPASLRGEKLRHDVDRYADFVTSMLSDTTVIATVRASLSTAPIRKAGLAMPVAWEEAKFDSQPVVAAVTHLTKLQNDLRYAEGEALQHLLQSIDAGDVRVNSLNAFVIPNSRLVMRGGRYTANIVLAAVDTTARPLVFVGGKQLANDRGLYEFTPTATGTFDYSGYISLPQGESELRLPFSSSYTVMEPTATVSATMMNVLYAGIDNPMSIGVPGVASQNVTASMTNGSLSRQGDAWVAKPAEVGREAVVTVTATIDGKPQTVSTTAFKVRRLPDPTAYIAIAGASGTERYKGGRPISKSALTSAQGLGAAIDDDMLNIDFRVLSFETVMFDSMGNAIPEVSDGPNFSSRQRDSFRRLSRGKRFYISRVKAIGPDGVERTLNPVEVIVN